MVMQIKLVVVVVTHLILVPPKPSFFHPSHVPDAFLFQKHEQYTSILKLNRKGVFYGTEVTVKERYQ